MESKEKIIEAWKALHPAWKICGCVVFAYIVCKTIPVINGLLHLLVLLTMILFVAACVVATDETVTLLDNYRKVVMDYLKADSQPEQPENK